MEKMGYLPGEAGHAASTWSLPPESQGETIQQRLQNIKIPVKRNMSLISILILQFNIT